MTDDKITRMQQLVSELNEASDAYYNGRAELMTDYEWDQRFDELKRLETETGTTLPDSPTQKVSEDTITGQKEAHEFAALSLAKTKQTGELVKWAEERPIWISWKLDGLTLVVTYDDGRLTKVVTRGNGHIGTNITHLSRSISGIPQEISAKGHTVIRGEAVISYDDFERFVMESGEDYANPRNLASGSLTLKDADEVKARHIQWIPFTLVYTQWIPFTLVYTEEDITSWGKRMDWLDQQGFTTVERRLIEQPDHGTVESGIAAFTEEVTSKQNPYPVDGLVVCKGHQLCDKRVQSTVLEQLRIVPSAIQEMLGRVSVVPEFALDHAGMVQDALSCIDQNFGISAEHVVAVLFEHFPGFVQLLVVNAYVSTLDDAVLNVIHSKRHCGDRTSVCVPASIQGDLVYPYDNDLSVLERHRVPVGPANEHGIRPFANELAGRLVQCSKWGLSCFPLEIADVPCPYRVLALLFLFHKVSFANSPCPRSRLAATILGSCSVRYLLQPTHFPHGRPFMRLLKRT